MIPTPEPLPGQTPCHIDSIVPAPLIHYDSWGNPDCLFNTSLEGNVTEGLRHIKIMEFTIDNPDNEFWLIGFGSSDADTFLLLYEWNEDDDDYELLLYNDDMEPGNITDSQIEWIPITGVQYALHKTTYDTSVVGALAITIEPTSGLSE